MRPACRCVAVALALRVRQRAPPEGDAIVVALANSAVNLDPRVGADEASQKAHQLLYSTLFASTTNLQVVPDLAESLERPDPTSPTSRGCARACSSTTAAS